MRRSVLLTTGAALLGALVSVSASAAPTRSSIDVAPRLGASLAQVASSDWPTVGGNLWQQRFSALTQITTSNAKNLKLEWVKSIHGATGAEIEGSPLVYHGVMYVVTGEGNVAALDAATGALLWKYARHIPLNSLGIEANRGIALGEGKVFVAQANGTLAALDQRTGERLWVSPIVLRGDPFLGPATPVYYDGVVYVGMSGGDAGARGHFDAFDAASGRQVWRFYTIPE